MLRPYPLMTDKSATGNETGASTAWAALPPHRDHPGVLGPPMNHWDRGEGIEDQTGAGAKGGDGPITEKAKAATMKLQRLALEAKDAWQQLGQSIIDMRGAAPRNAFVRRHWLDEIGLASYSRAAQISTVTWWAKNREDAEQAGVAGPFAFTPTSIRAAYDKRKSKPAKQTSDVDRIIDDLGPEDVSGTRYTAEDFLQAEAPQLEHEVARMTQTALRHGEDDISAAQAALARAMALVRVATRGVEMAHVRAEMDDADPDGDF